MAMTPGTLAVVAAVAGKMLPAANLRDVLYTVFGVTDPRQIFTPVKTLCTDDFPPPEWWFEWSTKEERQMYFAHRTW